MDYTRVIKVFLASPMDLAPERKAFFQIIDRINNATGKNLHLQYQVVSWENDVLPNKGDDAQDVVNAQIDMDYDVFVSVFRDRIGTPTKRAVSGTVEEYERAILYRCSNPTLQFMCYFLQCENEPEDIRTLKDRMRSDGVLFFEQADMTAFENSVFLHFSTLLLKIARQLGVNKDSVASQRIRKAVAVALVTPDNQLLIVKRSSSCKFGSDLWQIPGGKINAGESPEKAAVREMQEELGITISEDQLKPLRIFHSYFLNDINQPFDMYLYLYHIDNSCLKIQLNEENQHFEWVDLCVLTLNNKPFLGINQDLVRVVWQETGTFGLVWDVLDYLHLANTTELPLSLPNISRDKLHMLYSTLAVLGLVEFKNKPVLSSPFSLKLLEALVYLSRSGGQLFENNHQDKTTTLKMLPEDYSLLRQYRESTLYSHKSLLAIMSCKTELPHSSRDVNNVLIFGRYKEDLYILLRWDFYSQKYQILGTGINNATELTVNEMAQVTISKRLSSVAIRYFDLLPLKSFTTHHFAAGSVDNDPIMRQYRIHVVAATVRSKSRQDFLEMVDLVNSTTQLTLEFSLMLPKEQSKTLNYLSWCKIDALLKDRNNYLGRKVRGFDELISNIGRIDLLRLGQNAVTLTEDALHDSLDMCIAKHEKISNPTSTSFS